MGENQCLCHKRHWVMFSTFANRNCHRHHSNGSKAAVLWAFPFPFQCVSFFPIYLLNGNVASIHPSNWRATNEKLMKRTNIYKYIYMFLCASEIFEKSGKSLCKCVPFWFVVIRSLYLFWRVCSTTWNSWYLWLVAILYWMVLQTIFQRETCALSFNKGNNGVITNGFDSSK